jgi:hypothetical protein
MNGCRLSPKLSSSFVFDETNKRFTILNIYPVIDDKREKTNIIIIEEAFKPTSNKCCNIS